MLNTYAHLSVNLFGVGTIIIMLKNLAKMCLVWLSLIGIAPIFVLSQVESDLVVTGTFFRTDDFKWSSDSTQLTFYNFELGTRDHLQWVDTDSVGWQTIDAKTGILSTGVNGWSLQPTLSVSDQNVMMPVQYVYQSPDNNLLIFAQEPPDNIGRYSLVIANRNTGQIVALNLESSVYPFNPNFFDVQWSADNHAAIIAYGSMSGKLQVFHLDVPDFGDLQDTRVQEFETVIHGLPYSTTAAIEDDILDISTDGQFVLLIARDTTAHTSLSSFYDNPPELVIWNPYTDYADIVTTNITMEQFLKGSFAPSDNTKLLLANSQGLFVYDLVSNETQLLRNDFDTSNTRYYFSPDGKWLAVVGDNAIRLISIEVILSESTH
jgi:hypothetical protein